jgi:hypothetical protein
MPLSGLEAPTEYAPLRTVHGIDVGSTNANALRLRAGRIVAPLIVAFFAPSRRRWTT